MTGTFWDTIVVCTITGLAIASSGVLGQIDPATGQLYVGSALTIAAFSTVLGKVGGYLVTIGITLLLSPQFLDGNIMEKKLLNIFWEHTNLT